MLTIKIHGDNTYTNTISLHESYGVPSVGDTLNLECSTGLKKKFIQLRVVSRTFTYHDFKCKDLSEEVTSEVTFVEKGVELMCVRVGS